MHYFDYLNATKKEDTKETFIEYLIFRGDTKEEAQKVADFLYK